jgi:hypothetical protein
MEDTTVSHIGTVKAKQNMTMTKDGKIILEESLGELMAAWKTPLEAHR